MDNKEKSLEMHLKNRGKIEIKSKVKVNNKEDLALAYTPGVAEPCKKIVENKEDIYKYTSKGNTIAIVTDGTAVLGLGDIGPEASLPVMEGKSVLFKEFGNIDCIPICIKSKDVNTIVETIKLITPSMGGINLEDISAPRCFEIEERLKKELNIPVFHDDQHGTAIVVLAGLINSARLLKKDISDFNIVINGSGAAGIATVNLLLKAGARNIVVCDSKGAINKEREDLNSYKKELSKLTNKKDEKGKLEDIIKGKDVFIGVSAPNVLTEEMVRNMECDPIIFALSNPVPEIYPEIAKKAGARIIATGRSDYPNQINNVLAFPGIFRGALDIGAEEITEEMKISTAYGIAKMVSEEELTEEFIIPDVFNKEVAKNVAGEVKRVYRKV